MKHVVVSGLRSHYGESKNRIRLLSLVLLLFLTVATLLFGGFKAYEKTGTVNTPDRVNIFAKPKAGVETESINYVLDGLSLKSEKIEDEGYLISIPKKDYQPIQEALFSTNLFENVGYYLSNPSGNLVKEPSENVKNELVDGRVNSYTSDGKLTDKHIEDLKKNKKQSSSFSSISPEGVPFVDETGRLADKESMLKEFLKTKLYWQPADLDNLQKIVITNAGDTGWSGLAAMASSGSSVGGCSSADTCKVDYDDLETTIYLNSYYLSSDYDYQNVLSHEYGHHFTMYYIVTKYDIAFTERIPSEYYQIRPLDAILTSPNYSKGWAFCDKEIIAEDYKYFFSPFHVNGPSVYFGLPSDPGARSWIYSLSGKTLPIDTVAPEVDILAPKPNEAVSGYYYASFDITDNYAVAKTDIYIDGVLKSTFQIAPKSYQINTGLYSNSTHTLTLRVVDSSGNTAEKSVDFLVQNTGSVDLLPPVVRFITPISEEVVNGVVKVVIEAIDNVKVKAVYFEVDKGSFAATDNRAPYEISWDTTKLSDGYHKLSVVAEDTSGNFSSSSITVKTANAALDNENPIVTIKLPINESTVKTPFSVNAIATDDGSVLKMVLYIDGYGVAQSQGGLLKYRVKPLVAGGTGKHVLTIRAWDIAGNQSEQTINYYIK
jgi:hypothetical protein